MAKAKKVVTVKAIRDEAGAKEAMKIVGKSLRDVNAAMDKAAAETATGKAQKDMSALTYAWGLGIKATGKAEFPEAMYIERFDAYAAKHWKPHEMPADNTLDQYRSNYRAFAQMAWAKYDAREVVQECLTIDNVLMSWRAGRMREFAKLDAKPSKADIAKALVITKAATATGGGSGDVLIARFVTAGITLAKDAKVKAFLAKNAHIAEWLEPMLRELIVRRKADTATMKRAQAQKDVATAEKYFPAIVAKGNARRGAALH